MTKEMSRNERDHPDRWSSRRREGSTSSSSSRDRDRDRSGDKDRLAIKEEKRLRNEGEHKLTGLSNKSESSSNSKLSSTTSRQSPSASAALTTVAPVPMESKMVEDQDTCPTPLDSKELYENVVEYENNLAKRLDVAQTLTEGQNLCKQLEKNCKEIIDMISISEAPKDMEDFEEMMDEGLLKISRLRQTNRMMKLKLKSVKDDQLSVRSDVDCDHLLLQNLLYEATYLQNQVAAVQDYKGMDELIDLVSVEQFYEQAPTKICKPDHTKKDSHLLRIARLEYEFVQRQKLTEDCNSLEKEKESVSKSIEETQTKLESIGPLLKSVLEATKPIQQVFGIDISSKKEHNAIAQYLPPELYVLYVQSNGFKEANGKNDFAIHLRGNLEDAKELIVTPDEVEEDSDSDKEQDQDQDVETSRRRLMRKKSSIYLSPEDSKKKLVQRHPLWIEWIVHSKGPNAVFIQFFYLIKLKIVTVKARTVEDVKKIPDGEMTTSENLLDELFPDDKGLESPNPANRYMFQKVDAKEIADFVSETGRPFLWAQKLAGVQFPSFPDVDQNDDVVPIRPRMETSALNIEKVLKAIRLRLSNQTILYNQLKLLETRNIQIPSGAKELFPPKISTTFKSWETITLDSYSSYSFAKEHLRAEIISQNCMFFRALLERGRALIVALVALTSNFPLTPPVFCFQLEKDGEKRNSTNDAAVRDLESEVNIHSLQDFQDWPEILLSLQLMRLIQGVDIILETDFMVGESSGPSEFAREKLLLRASTGRNLRRPFKYFGSGGGYFSQRY